MKTLKHIPQIIGITLCAFALTACEKEKFPELELHAELDMAYEDILFTVPASEFTGAVELELEFDPQEVEDLLLSNGYQMDDLKEVRLTSAKVDQVNGTGTFDAIGMVQLRMAAAGYLDQLIAQVQDVAPGSTSIELNVGGENVMEMFRYDNAQLKVVGQVTEPLEQDLPLRAAVTFKIVVKTGA